MYAPSTDASPKVRAVAVVAVVAVVKQTRAARYRSARKRFWWPHGTCSAALMLRMAIPSAWKTMQVCWPNFSARWQIKRARWRIDPSVASWLIRARKFGSLYATCARQQMPWSPQPLHSRHSNFLRRSSRNSVRSSYCRERRPCLLIFA